jgi:hypothetical protein
MIAESLQVTMSDGTIWSIPAKVIAEDRAKHYATIDSERSDQNYETVFKDEMEYALSDASELKEWATDNMNWCDVAAHAVKIGQVPPPPADYSADWVDAPKVVK